MVTPHTQSSDESTISMVITHTQSSDEWTVSMVTSNSDEWTVSMVTSHTQSLDEWTVSMVTSHTKFRWVNSFHGHITHTKLDEWIVSMVTSNSDEWTVSMVISHTQSSDEWTVSMVVSHTQRSDEQGEKTRLVGAGCRASLRIDILHTQSIYTYYKWESTPKKIQTFACYHWTTVATLYSEEFWNMFPGFWILKSNMDI